MTVALSGDLHRGPDTHANRPAATAVGVGTLYECTTHSLIYRSDGSAWSTYAAVLPAAGTSGNVLTSDGSAWSSQPSAGGGGGASQMVERFSYNNYLAFERTETGTWATYSATPFPNAIGGGQYYSSSAAINDAVGIGLYIPTGTYDLIHWAATSTAYAIVTYEVEDAPGAGTYTSLGTNDWYSSSAVYSVKKTLTGVTVGGTSGYRRLRLRASSKNASSSGYIVNIQALLLMKTA